MISIIEEQMFLTADQSRWSFLSRHKWNCWRWQRRMRERTQIASRRNGQVLRGSLLLESCTPWSYSDRAYRNRVDANEQAKELVRCDCGRREEGHLMAPPPQPQAYLFCLEEDGQPYHLVLNSIPISSRVKLLFGKEALYVNHLKMGMDIQ